MNNNAIKFPFHFSEDLLLKDLQSCKSHDFVAHYSTNDYEGSWTSISLRSSNGLPQNIKAFDPMSDVWVDTSLLADCDYFQEIIDSFNCEKYAIRLLNLAAGSQIKEHTDHNLGYGDGIFRVHIPITTNDSVQFIIGGNLVPMKVGESWYGDFNVPHSVKNLGATERVHLTIDCKRNDWSDGLFENAGYDFSIENEATEYDDITKRNMLISLEKMNNEASRKLICQLRKELGE